MLLKHLSLYLALGGMIAAGTLVYRSTHTAPPAPPPLAEPSRSPYTDSVAATGIIEATRENVKIAPPKAGLVQKVFVKVGSTVKAGAPLLQLDDREARARLESAQAQIETLRKQVELEEVQAADMKDQLDRVTRLEKTKVASEDELKRKEFAWQLTQTRLAKATADFKFAESQVRQATVDLEILTVKAPRDGKVLQVNVREGEYASPAITSEPMMVLGDVDKLQVRADVDEQNAPMVAPGQPATAFLKGSTENPLPLRFVRIEPFVIPKRSLTGDSTERVDTRVLQVIFELDNPNVPLYVGQQVDVFIKRPDADNETNRPHTEAK